MYNSFGVVNTQVRSDFEQAQGTPTIFRIILEVENYEFSFSQLSGVLDNRGYSNRKGIISRDVKLDFQGNS